MMTRREFIKVAGAGVLAVSCAGMLSGCDVVDSIKEALEDEGAARATISNVTFITDYAILNSNSTDGSIRYSTNFYVRNKNSDSVTIPKENITGQIYDLADKCYKMTYTGADIKLEGNSGKVEIKDFWLQTTEAVAEDSSLRSFKYKKAIFTIKYKGKKAVFTDDNEKHTITPQVVGN